MNKLPIITKLLPRVTDLAKKIEEVNRDRSLETTDELTGRGYLKTAYKLTEKYKLTTETAEMFKERLQEILRVQLLVLEMPDIDEQISEGKMFDTLGTIFKKTSV